MDAITPGACGEQRIAPHNSIEGKDGSDAARRLLGYGMQRRRRRTGHDTYDRFVGSRRVGSDGDSRRCGFRGSNERSSNGVPGPDGVRALWRHPNAGFGPDRYAEAGRLSDSRENGVADG